MLLSNPAKLHVLGQLIEIVDRAIIASMMMIRVVHDDNRRMPRVFNGSQMIRKDPDSGHPSPVHPGLQSEGLQLGTLIRSGNRHLSKRDVVIKVDLKLRSDIFDRHRTPGRVVGIRTDYHVGIASWFRVLREGHRLRAGGWDPSFKPTGMGPGFLQGYPRD